MNGQWRYDSKDGTLRLGAKLIAVLYDDKGRPYARNKDEADRFGKLIAESLNAPKKLAHTCSGFGPSLGQCVACNAGDRPTFG